MRTSTKTLHEATPCLRRLCIVVKARVAVFFTAVATRRSKKKFILSRTACLGTNVLKLVIRDDVRCVNYQKDRVDVLLHTQIRVSALRLKKFIARDDILSILAKQGRGFWCLKSPSCVVLDSFSELTDQKFVDIDGGQFFCNFSDVVSGSMHELTCQGLMPVSDIGPCYRLLFERINCFYGSQVPIIFIHFSAALDAREKFRARARAIRQTINELSALKIYNLHTVDVADELIVGGQDGFSYHYSVATYKLYEKELRSVFQGLGLAGLCD